jgi:Xaa-Pro aminopeptidase
MRALEKWPDIKMYEIRLAKLKDKFYQKEVDAFLITNLINIRYLTGFTGSNALLLIDKRNQYFITDSRYLRQAEKEVSGFIIEEQKKSLVSTIKAFLDIKRCRILGVEGEDLSLERYQRLKNGLPKIRIKSLKKMVEDLRIRKDEEEIKKIRFACKEIQKAILEVVKKIKEGVTELEIASEIEYILKRKGLKVSFDTIVASGINSSFPHAKATKKKIKNNQFLLIDGGASFSGYNSDITRTLILGDGDKKKREILNLVKDALEYGVSLVSKGVGCLSLDKKVREYLDKKGFGKYFIHNLGHGVGLEVHEDPIVGRNISEDLKIEDNMVITIEPGIYIPNFGGVRIEHTILVKEKGCEIFTKDIPVEIEI